MYKLNQKQPTDDTYIVEEESVNKIERDKHGSIIHKNYQAEVVFPKDQPLTVRAQPRKRYNPYLRPFLRNGYEESQRDRPSSSFRDYSRDGDRSSSSFRDYPREIKSEVKQEVPDVVKVETPSDWDAASNILENLFNES